MKVPPLVLKVESYIECRLERNQTVLFFSFIRIISWSF